MVIHIIPMYTNYECIPILSSIHYVLCSYHMSAIINYYMKSLFILRLRYHVGIILVGSSDFTL